MRKKYRRSFIEQSAIIAYFQHLGSKIYRIILVFVPVIISSCQSEYQRIGKLWGTMGHRVFGANSSFGVG